MAKKAQFDPKAAVKLASELVAMLTLAAGEASPAASAAETEKEVDVPSAEAITAMKKSEVRVLCEQLSIDTEDKDIADLRAALITLSNVAHGEDVEADDVTTLLGILDLAVSKKASANLQAVKDYLQADTASTEDDDDEKEEDEKEEDADAEGDDDEKEEDGDDDEAKPEGKKPAKADAEDDEAEDDEAEDGEDGEEGDDDEKEEDADAEGDDDDEKEEKADDDDAEGDEEADGDDEVSEKDQKKRLAAYNEKAEKPLKTYAKLAELLLDDDGDTAKWGVPYIKDESFHCCGLPLEDVKHKKKDAGQCQITGSIFVQDDEGGLKKVA
jgi:hypothetical protein